MKTNERATITNLTADMACQLHDAGFCIYWTSNNTFELCKEEDDKQEKEQESEGGEDFDDEDFKKMLADITHDNEIPF